jgi:hypothetical protein
VTQSSSKASDSPPAPVDEGFTPADLAPAQKTAPESKTGTTWFLAWLGIIVGASIWLKFWFLLDPEGKRAADALLHWDLGSGFGLLGGDLVPLILLIVFLLAPLIRMLPKRRLDRPENVGGWALEWTGWFVISLLVVAVAIGPGPPPGVNP